ncbi:MAG: SUF system NifU family Fe-S cluster assembly protein [Chthonomonadales bacterium]|nr:SUF system NifU family Fe-S cluster assembly protein [Chthonomonadales bacterium]
MSELRELYQEIILDHNKRPRNFRVLESADHRAVGHNPLCGDQISVFVELDGDVIRDVSFEGAGCAISKASASMMTEAVKGKTRAEVQQLFDEFHAMVTSSPDTLPDVDKIGKLAAFAGVCEFPARVKCASLAWHTLQAAINGASHPVSTE